jgi:hypothetical protein
VSYENYREEKKQDNIIIKKHKQRGPGGGATNGSPGISINETDVLNDFLEQLQFEKEVNVVIRKN